MGPQAGLAGDLPCAVRREGLREPPAQPCLWRRWGGASQAGTAGGADAEDGEPARTRERQAAVNQEIKRHLTRILLDVTDTIFGVSCSADFWGPTAASSGAAHLQAGPPKAKLTACATCTAAGACRCSR